MRGGGGVYIVVVDALWVVVNIQHIQCARASLLIVSVDFIQEPG